MVRTENLFFAYGKGAPVLRGIDIDIEKGTMVSLLGANGSGKSTLFKCMLGLLCPDSGRVLIDESDIRSLKRREIARKAAYIPQETASVFDYTVGETVLMGTTAFVGAFSAPGERERLLAKEALSLLGIEELSDRSVRRISGGERRMTLIARALAQQAGVLFMDEPTEGLDYGNQLRVLERMRELAKKGYTIIGSTHHPEQAYLYADRVLALKNGTIIADGSPGKVLSASLIKELYGVDVPRRFLDFASSIY